ncbi:MAG: PTS sugar transporter subunit IIA, partial [Kiritimatiellae bacterium]|nr:PTS sugar transporter subunit IIA [Kiritimatiellia bacterium]
YPDGIAWEDDVVKLVIGIAVKDGNDHIDVLGYISEACDSDEATDKLVMNASIDTIYKKLNGLA